jgi:hypothetical protein
LADLGKSILGILDIDADLSFGEGNLALAHDIARRLVTEPGGLTDSPGYGYGLQLLLSSTVDAPSVERRIAEQCLQDERVRDVEVSVTQDEAEKTITVGISLQTADGPFEFTLAVSQLSVELLLPQAA